MTKPKRRSKLSPAPLQEQTPLYILRTLSIAICCLLSFGLIGEYRPDRFEIEPWEYGVIYDYVYDNMPRRSWRYKKPKAHYASNYVQHITNISRQYYWSPHMVMRWVREESRFKWWARSHKDAIGPLQARVEKYWSGTLHNILPPKIQRKILMSTNAMREYIHYAKTIEYGMPLGAHILAYYLERQKTVPYALMAYNRGDAEICKGKLTVFGKAKRDINELYKDRYVWSILRPD